MKKILVNIGLLFIGMNLNAITSESVLTESKEIEQRIYKKYENIQGDPEKIAISVSNEIILAANKNYEKYKDLIISKSHKKFKNYIEKYYTDSQSAIYHLIQMNDTLFPKEIYGYQYSTENKTAVTTIAIESHILNLSILDDYYSNKAGFESNEKKVYDYLYFRGESKTKKEYMEMTPKEINAILDLKRMELNREILQQQSKSGESRKKELIEISKNINNLNKEYINYFKSYETLISGMKIETKYKEKMLKLAKFEMAMSLTFLTNELKAGK